jgi:signal transduction histidine kinase
VNDVLDPSKIEAGEMLVRVETARAKAIIDEAFAIIGAEAAGRGLSLHEDWHCDESVEVIADSSRARQIILNLLSNALKFTPAGGSITMRCRIADEPPAEAALPEVAPWVVLEVEDTGTGIPNEQLSRIFQPFVQAETGHTRTVGGTGLGLTISRRLARLMGGDLTVRSSVGEGSLFCLWLPTPGQDLRRLRADRWQRAPRRSTI